MSYHTAASHLARFESKLALSASLSKTLRSQLATTARPKRARRTIAAFERPWPNCSHRRAR